MSALGSSKFPAPQGLPVDPPSQLADSVIRGAEFARCDEGSTLTPVKRGSDPTNRKIRGSDGGTEQDDLRFCQDRDDGPRGHARRKHGEQADAQSTVVPGENDREYLEAHGHCLTKRRAKSRVRDWMRKHLFRVSQSPLGIEASRCVALAVSYLRKPAKFPRVAKCWRSSPFFRDPVLEKHNDIIAGKCTRTGEK